MPIPVPPHGDDEAGRARHRRVPRGERERGRRFWSWHLLGRGWMPGRFRHRPRVGLPAFGCLLAGLLGLGAFGSPGVYFVPVTGDDLPVDGGGTAPHPADLNIGRAATAQQKAGGPRPAGGGLPALEGRPHVDGVVMDAYRDAAAWAARTDPSCNLHWSLLAGIGHVESHHAAGVAVTRTGDTAPSILGPQLNGAGEFAAISDTDAGRFDADTVWDRAVGPMQFIPSSWASMGEDGNGDGVANPNNVYDAAAGAAGYLCAGDRDLSALADRREAVFGYNHSWEYVSLVLRLAELYGNGGLRVASDPVAPVPAQATSESAANGDAVSAAAGSSRAGVGKPQSPTARGDRGRQGSGGMSGSEGSNRSPHSGASDSGSGKGSHKGSGSGGSGSSGSGGSGGGTGSNDGRGSGSSGSGGSGSGSGGSGSGGSGGSGGGPGSGGSGDPSPRPTQSPTETPSPPTPTPSPTPTTPSPEATGPHLCYAEFPDASRDIQDLREHVECVPCPVTVGEAVDAGVLPEGEIPREAVAAQEACELPPGEWGTDDKDPATPAPSHVGDGFACWTVGTRAWCVVEVPGLPVPSA